VGGRVFYSKRPIGLCGDEHVRAEKDETTNVVGDVVCGRSMRRSGEFCCWVWGLMTKIRDGVGGLECKMFDGTFRVLRYHTVFDTE